MEYAKGVSGLDSSWGATYGLRERLREKRVAKSSWVAIMGARQRSRGYLQILLDS